MEDGCNMTLIHRWLELSSEHVWISIVQMDPFRKQSRGEQNTLCLSTSSSHYWSPVNLSRSSILCVLLCESFQLLADWLSDSGRRQPALLRHRRSLKISMDLILRHVDTHLLAMSNNNTQETGMVVAGHGVTACPCSHSTVSHYCRLRKQERGRGCKNRQGRATWDWSYNLVDQADGATDRLLDLGMDL